MAERELLVSVISVPNPLPQLNRLHLCFVGMGLLGGALAGAVVGNVVAKHQGAAKTAAAPAAPPVAQVVETGVPDANGCYKQTVKEPVPGNAKLYTETVHLICPNRPAVANPQAVVVPVQVVHHAAPAAVAAPAAASIPAITAAHHGLNATSHNATQVVVAPPAAAPAAGHPVTTSYVPVAPAQQPTAAGPAQVILLSKTVKKQKQRSAAASLNVSHALLILLVLYCLIRHV